MRKNDWSLPALVALLAATAVIYLWTLDRSGWANSYYAAATQAATQSWKAFFFGSFDSSNFITIDKTPGFLWLMGLSARVFGVNPWSILVPEALCGVATVGLVYAGVRRWWGTGAGLVAGLVVALTPVAALMFRYNNPEALFTLVLAAAAYSLMRAIENGRTWWLVLTGALVGFGFLTKMLEAFVVVPPFAVAYLVTAKPRLLKRIWQAAVAGAAVAVSAGWWVAVVQLWPASSRPFIGGSTTNSVLQLAFGYNGLGRLNGTEIGAVGPQGPVTGSWINSQIFGKTGILRLLRGTMATEIGWLLPTAVTALALGVLLAVLYRQELRTGRMFRAALLVWGGWLVAMGLVFSYMQGIFHPYYNVVLAPPMGAVLGMVVAELWRRRNRIAWRACLAALVAASAVWGWQVLAAHAPGWRPGLRLAVAIVGVAAAVMFVGFGSSSSLRWRRGLTVAVAGATVVGVLGASTAWTLATIATPHLGAIPSSGPPAEERASGALVDGLAGPAAKGAVKLPVPNPRPPLDPELVALLRLDASSFRWAAAMTSASVAAPIQLGTGVPIMAIGGFNGTDRSMTLADFQKLVAARQIHYYIAGGGYAGSPNTGVEAEIAVWAQWTFVARKAGTNVLYDLTQPRAPAKALVPGYETP